MPDKPTVKDVDVLDAENLTFPFYQAFSGKSLRAIYETESGSALWENSLKGVMKSKPTSGNHFINRANETLKMLVLISNSKDTEDPKIASAAIREMVIAQNYIHHSFEAFQDRLNVIRRRLLLHNRTIIETAYEASSPRKQRTSVDQTFILLTESFRAAVVDTRPIFRMHQSQVKNLKECFNRTVSIWIKKDLEEINKQLAIWKGSLLS